MLLGMSFKGAKGVFGTLVAGGAMDGEKRRYDTWAEAEAGQADVVRMVTEQN
jgi:hypothetical protein